MGAAFALFAVEAALAAFLAACGIVPDFVAGHSIGELTAAYVAGVWSLRDACQVVAARARLMQALPPGGTMASVALPEAQAAALLPAGVSVAAVNTAESVVVSGPGALVDQVMAAAAARGARVSRLRVSHAFHSALMDPVLGEFREVLESVRFAEPAIPVVSGLTGRPAAAGELCSPGYWVRQVRDPVRFAGTLAWLAGHGVTALVEAGPGTVLSGLATCVTGPGPIAVPLLRHSRRTHRPPDRRHTTPDQAKQPGVGMGMGQTGVRVRRAGVRARQIRA